MDGFISDFGHQKYIEIQYFLCMIVKTMLRGIRNTNRWDDDETITPHLTALIGCVWRVFTDGINPIPTLGSPRWGCNWGSCDRMMRVVLAWVV